MAKTKRNRIIKRLVEPRTTLIVYAFYTLKLSMEDIGIIFKITTEEVWLKIKEWNLENKKEK